MFKEEELQNLSETQNIPEQEEMTAEKDSQENDQEKIILNNPQEIIFSAENKGKIWRSLFDRVQAEYGVAREISGLEGLTNKDGKMEAQIENMKTIVNMAFIKKENAEHPERRFLDRLYKESINSQDFVNLMLKGEGMYFNSEGKTVSLEGYLKDYYKDLTESGFDIRIGESIIDNFEYLVNNEELKDGVDQVRELERIGKKMSTLILVDQERGERKTIPIICADKLLQDAGAYAMYAWAEKGDKSVRDRILVRPVKELGGEEKSVPEVAGTFVHEIDHAVYNFLHESSIKRYERELKEINRKRSAMEKEKENLKTAEEVKHHFEIAKGLYEEECDLKRQILVAGCTKRMGKSVVLEGLARQTQRSFIKDQIKGLAGYSSYKNGFVDGTNLLIDEQRISDQVNMGMLYYSSGEILVSEVSGPMSKSQLYKTDELEKKIIENPESIKSIIKHLATNRNKMVEETNKLCEQPAAILSDDQLKLSVKSGMGDYRVPFLLGEEYFNIIENIDEEVDKKNLDELRQDMEQMIDKDSELAGYILKKYQGTGDINKIRQAVKEMHMGIGKLKDRSVEEFNKIFKTEER